MDLLALAAELVGIPSVSHHETALADIVEARLRGARHLQVHRLDNTVVARTQLGRTRRVVLAGHLDTVPPFADGAVRVEGDVLWGLGAVDMKGGLAVLLDLAMSVADPAMDLTYVFYDCEEVNRRHSGLGRLVARHPDMLGADAAVLTEPTGGSVEAGCQGTIRAVVSLGGRRAHTARPWMGTNAVHRLAPVLAALSNYRSHRVVIDDCEFAEQLQAVAVEGGVAGNVVPDRATVTVNYRFTPECDVPTALHRLEGLLGLELDAAAGDVMEVVDAAPGAPPALGHPVLAALVAASGGTPRAKVGWTDVATFF